MPIDPKTADAPALGVAGDVQQLLGNLKERSLSSRSAISTSS